MANRLQGKVAVITGAARGQGRSHALRLAQEGADIIALDICEQLETVKPFYDMPSMADLGETERLVRQAGGRIETAQADVRDLAGLERAIAAGVDRFGRLDTVVANAGIFAYRSVSAHDAAIWQDIVDVNVTGVWNTVKACLPGLTQSGPGGSVIIISSLAGTKGLPNLAAYATAKHAIVGLRARHETTWNKSSGTDARLPRKLRQVVSWRALMKVLANELGPLGIRVNTVHPNAIDTPMIANLMTRKLFRPDLEEPTPEEAAVPMTSLNPMGVGMLDPIHVSNVVLFLASDESY
jgi:NAD(P)-dependent dehydrogenase (short-subunit alcohol dehydrogenase family)